jgi:hypothetical protein
MPGPRTGATGTLLKSCEVLPAGGCCQISPGDNAIVIARFQTASNGTFHNQVTVPKNAKPGRYLMAVEGNMSFARATRTFD